MEEEITPYTVDSVVHPHIGNQQRTFIGGMIELYRHHQGPPSNLWNPSLLNFFFFFFSKNVKELLTYQSVDMD